MRGIWVAFWGCLGMLWGCNQVQENEIRPAFYHWKSGFELNANTKALIENHAANRLYVRYFDVDWPEEAAFPQPLAKVNWKERAPENLEIVPVVFITNRTVKKLDDLGADSLAGKMAKLLVNLHEKSGRKTFSEIQLDCDWTNSSRARYFRLLKTLRSHFPENTQFSATIRLHQFRRPAHTGIPPVDRGMVMLYNTGDLDDPEEDNSILTLQDVQDYLEQAPRYPIATDIALPAFTWSVIIRRGKTVKLLNDISMDSLLSHPDHIKTAENKVEVLRNHYFCGHYVYEGDVIRAEAIPGDVLLQIAHYAASKILPHPRYVALYHISSIHIQSYPQSTLEAIFDAFRHPEPRLSR